MNRRWHISFLVVAAFVLLLLPTPSAAIPAFSRRFVYRIHLEHDPSSRDGVQAAGATGPRDHTYLALGTLYFYGRTAQNFSGVLSAPPESSFFSPYSATRNRFTPGLQFLIHSNIKASFEYQIRPQQIVYDPATGLPLTKPFRTNAAIAGLEWAA